MKSLLLISAATLAVFAGLIGPSAADAQPKKAKGPRVIELEEFKIEGRVQKPNAFYILNRSNIGYEVLDLRTSFVKEIVRTIEKEPF
jgi:hypothetical protein